MDQLKRIYLEPSSRCNLSCAMCFRQTWQDEIFADMTMPVFIRCLEGLPDSVESLVFGGMGEPLVHREIVEMVALAAQKVGQVEIISNGSLLLPAMARELLEVGLNMLWISIDSFATDPFGHKLAEKDLDRLLQNIRAYNQARAGIQVNGRRAGLGINFVVSRSNIGQLGRIPDFARNFQVNRVNVSNFIPSSPEAEKLVLCNRVVEWGLGLPEPGQCRIDLPMLNWRDDGVMTGLRDLLSQNQAQVCLSGQTLSRRSHYCRFVEEGICLVRHDGLVAPCMELLHTSTTCWNGNQRLVKRHTFGSVGDQTIAEIWSGQEYADFRDKVREFDFSPCLLCTGCQLSSDNCQDCYGNQKPTCGSCLWAEGIVSCP